MSRRKFNPVRTHMMRAIEMMGAPLLAELRLSIRDLQLDLSLMYKAAQFVAADRIQGDYLEFGVYSGTTFVTAYHSFSDAYSRATTPGMWNTEEDCVERQKLWEQMRFIGFDSFQGLPKPKGPDLDSDDFAEGKFACSEERFLKRIWEGGVPTDRVRTVAGWYQDTLNDAIRDEYDIKSAAVVYVDCDYYDSAKLVLDFVTPCLVHGSVIVFDDWFNFRASPARGEQRACREWLEVNPDISLVQWHKEGPWRNSFIVHRLP